MLKFINNFATTLSQPIAMGHAAVLIPPAAAARLSPLLDNSNFSHQLILTLDDGANIEIIVIDEAYASDGSLFAYRGCEGTTERDWPGGTPIIARLTARALAALPALSVAMQLTDESGVLQDASGAILTNPDLPTFFGGADPFGLTDI